MVIKLVIFLVALWSTPTLATPIGGDNDSDEASNSETNTDVAWKKKDKVTAEE